MTGAGNPNTDPQFDRVAERSRFTRRLNFWETPAEAAWLEEHAAAWGTTVASTIRAAIRYYRGAHEN